VQLHIFNCSAEQPYFIHQPAQQRHRRDWDVSMFSEFSAVMNSASVKQQADTSRTQFGGNHMPQYRALVQAVQG
jgi:hypothetical protein